VLAAIRFDDDPSLVANEVGNETADLFLTPEFKAIKLPGFQMPP